MAVHILDGCKLYIQEFDLSADWNSGTLILSRSILDSTKFNSGGQEFCPDGLKGHTFNFTGFFDKATTFSPDDTIFDSLYGTNDLLTTVCPTDGTDGEIAYTFYDVINYTPIDGAAGTVAGFSVSAKGSGRMTRPTILKNCITAVTENGSGTAYNVGTCAPGHTLRAFVHVYEYDGGTLDLAIQSDTASGMASAVEQIGFTNATDVTKEAKTAQMGYLFYDNQSANFTASATLTGGTSGATATILADVDWGTEGCLLLGNITGTYQNNEEITDGEDPVGTADVNGTLGETYLAYDNEAGGPFTVANTITGVTSEVTGTLVALQDDGATGKLLISGASGVYEDDEEVGDGTATADAVGDSSAECYWRASWTYDGTACKFIVLLYID